MPSPIKKRILSADRRRRIPRSGYGWIDRRLITQGILEKLHREEHALYSFLCTVADQDGISFYGDRRICSALRGMTPEVLDRARRNLEHRGLILFRHPFYQVLEIPDELGHAPLRSADEQNRRLQHAADAAPLSIAEILRALSERDQRRIR
jgi:hypothetical protein